MSVSIPARLRAVVRRRAIRQCEYCRLHEEDADLTHEPDHVIALKHGGLTGEDNLAWTCFLCNRHKGTDVASIDPDSGDIVRLFHPRRDKWEDHFRTEGPLVIPLTPVGRVSVFLLQINRIDRVEVRELLHAAGRYPR